ncbi:MAG: PHP domain-containing protein [Candidatus Sumerlaeota bacterium]|nr:PHP domain-containing protein [Candidatus Sumerlaeota bacterium]
MIDLHTHSSASDGSLAPVELVAQAAGRKLGILALTDHDTAGGLEEFFDALKHAPGLRGIGGIEISAVGTRSGGGKEAHVLGYGFPARISERFAALLADFQASRENRGAAIVLRLQELGFDIAIEEVTAESKGDVIGRPHIAAVMVRKGYVATVTEAFHEYLATGAKAYVDRDRPTAFEAVRAIRDEGCAPVLAHPPLLNLPEDQLNKFVRELCEAGLVGLECYYSTYSDSDMGLCQKLAARYGLLTTGGSDFHGASKPEIHLGTGMGKLRIPDAVGEKLLEAISKLSLEQS